MPVVSDTQRLARGPAQAPGGADSEREGCPGHMVSQQLGQDWSCARAPTLRTWKGQGPREGKAVPPDESQAAH